MHPTPGSSNPPTPPTEQWFRTLPLSSLSNTSVPWPPPPLPHSATATVDGRQRLLNSRRGDARVIRVYRNLCLFYFCIGLVGLPLVWLLNVLMFRRGVYMVMWVDDDEEVDRGRQLRELRGARGGGTWDKGGEEDYNNNIRNSHDVNWQDGNGSTNNRGTNWQQNGNDSEHSNYNRHHNSDMMEGYGRIQMEGRAGRSGRGGTDRDVQGRHIGAEEEGRGTGHGKEPWRDVMEGSCRVLTVSVESERDVIWTHRLADWSGIGLVMATCALVVFIGCQYTMQGSVSGGLSCPAPSLYLQ
eukprot:GHVQ01040337.1.p1 GENE.GHVQ01040337.1~~GHVQ01040337.1.p1  ORF type:complete len:298 (-),score=61.61 GHVQ01040337.1:112-1005(-)